MSRRSPVAAVITAMVQRLTTSAGIAGVATVYNHVPQGTPAPYLSVSIPTDRREDTFGRYGAVGLVDVHVVSQARGDLEPAGLLDAAIQALNGQLLSLSGHATLGLTWDNSERFQEVVNGIVTRHHVGTFRIWTEQSST